jgi:hypothetical protein
LKLAKARKALVQIKLLLSKLQHVTSKCSRAASLPDCFVL